MVHNRRVPPIQCWPSEVEACWPCYGRVSFHLVVRMAWRAWLGSRWSSTLYEVLRISSKRWSRIAKMAHPWQRLSLPPQGLHYCSLVAVVDPRQAVPHQLPAISIIFPGRSISRDSKAWPPSGQGRNGGSLQALGPIARALVSGLTLQRSNIAKRVLSLRASRLLHPGMFGGPFV